MSHLIFVYNASSDYWSKKIDFAHKIISPKTYACSLCALTHGNFGETDLWRSFRINQKHPMEFIYKDEFQRRFPNQSTDYPIIFIKQSNNKLTEFISSKELAGFANVEELIKVVRNKLEAI